MGKPSQYIVRRTVETREISLARCPHVIHVAWCCTFSRLIYSAALVLKENVLSQKKGEGVHSTFESLIIYFVFSNPQSSIPNANSLDLRGISRASDVSGKRRYMRTTKPSTNSKNHLPFRSQKWMIFSRTSNILSQILCIVLMTFPARLHRLYQRSSVSSQRFHVRPPNKVCTIRRHLISPPPNVIIRPTTLRS